MHVPGRTTDARAAQSLLRCHIDVERTAPCPLSIAISGSPRPDSCLTFTVSIAVSDSSRSGRPLAFTFAFAS